MKVHHAILACLPGLLAVPLLAQPQIGGGTCSSATLSGSYSATLTGRDLSSSVTFSNVTQGVGSVTFDGLSKVVFTLTNNTNKLAGTTQTLSGTYSLQANCIGVLTINSGDSATFTLESYNTGKDYILTGEDGSYALSGNGSILPATCPSSFAAGTYIVNGSGFGLTSTVISSVFNELGIVTISGTNGITVSASVASAAGTKPISQTGTFQMGANCTATANLTDTAGNAYVFTFQFTASSGKDFALESASPVGFWTGTGSPQ